MRRDQRDGPLKLRRMASRFNVESSLPACKSAIESLDRIAPEAPFLALGQTVFWDEPMKSILALDLQRLGSKRQFLAGIHDTDYFAKHPMARPGDGFDAIPHNDASTRGVWSAAGEFSQLFGSETVVTRQMLARYGTNVHLLAKREPELLDELTSAFGWLGVVSLRPKPVTVADKSLKAVHPVLVETLRLSVERTLASIAEPTNDQKRKAEQVVEIAESAYNEFATLAEYYEDLLPRLHQLVSGECDVAQVTRTTSLLRFNLSTAHYKRFDLLSLFLDPETRQRAVSAYNRAVSGAEMYELERFGSGSIPFDLYIPGRGRGTLRLGRKGGVVMADRPIGFSYRSEPTSAAELAKIIEEKFGDRCVLVGKAVTLIGMLAREFVFVFHERASSYLHICRAFHRELKDSGIEVELNPILRVRLEAWDALAAVETDLLLPDVLAGPFKTKKITAKEFSAKWREVQSEQREFLEALAGAKKPTEFLDLLPDTDRWRSVRAEWRETEERFASLASEVEKFRNLRREVTSRMRDARQSLNELEHEMGRHWRAQILGREPSAADLETRKQFGQRIRDARQTVFELESEFRTLLQVQRELVANSEIARIRRRRDAILFELQAERARLIRSAITAKIGLRQAGFRPSAWWLPIVSPGGEWFRAIRARTEYYLESIT